MKIDVVLYDVTTFYFESQRADEIRNYGFSKDNKINEVQIVMGLLVDLQGRPIGYELFSGNTFDGKTLLKILKKLKERFELNKIVIVADKGINSKLNLWSIKQSGFDYIVSARIKNMPKQIQNEILSDSGYQTLSSTALEEEQEQIFKYKVIDYKNKIATNDKNNKEEHIIEEKLLCCYSSKRAEKDRLDRFRSIQKAKEIIDNQDISRVNTKKGYLKYVNKVGKEEIEMLCLDYQKIEKEAQFDGYYALEYSDLSMKAEDVMEYYHNLYKIEESFRILKSTMQSRPIYLHTKEHIEGHFVICFLAFLLERELEVRIRQRNLEFSADKIKQALNSMMFREIVVDENTFFAKSKNEPFASKLFEILKIKLPNSLITKEQVVEYLNSV